MQQDPNNYWMQMERLERLIRASELKAGIIFSFHSLILGLFFDRLEYLQEVFHNSGTFIALICLWMVFVLISIYFAFKCFMPRMELKYDKNVFFFRDAINAFGGIDDYTKKLNEVCKNEEELFKHLSHQIHIESKIIDHKFKSVQKSIKYFAISFIFLFLILLLFLINLKTVN